MKVKNMRDIYALILSYEGGKKRIDAGQLAEALRIVADVKHHYPEAKLILDKYDSRRAAYNVRKGKSSVRENKRK